MMFPAIRSHRAKVDGYISKLENYDHLEIAHIATEHGLCEEALTIYKKYGEHALAMSILVEHIVSIE